MKETHVNVSALELQSTVHTIERRVLSINTQNVYYSVPVSISLMHYLNFNFFFFFFFFFIKDFCVLIAPSLMNSFISYSSHGDYIRYKFKWDYIVEKWNLDMALGNVNLLEEISLMSPNMPSDRLSKLINEVVRVRTNIIKLIEKYNQYFTNSCNLVLVKYVRDNFTDIEDLTIPKLEFK